MRSAEEVRRRTLACPYDTFPDSTHKLSKEVEIRDRINKRYRRYRATGDFQRRTTEANLPSFVRSGESYSSDQGGFAPDGFGLYKCVRVVIPLDRFFALTRLTVLPTIQHTSLTMKYPAIMSTTETPSASGAFRTPGESPSLRLNVKLASRRNHTAAPGCCPPRPGT